MSTTQNAPSITGNYVPFIESDANAPAEQLRTTMQETGYLFFRGLVPAERVLEARRSVLELCSEAGWLDPSRDLMDAIAAPGQKPLVEGMPEYMPVYRRVLKTPSFFDFPTEPSLMRVAEKVLDSEAFVHPRRIGRITFPNLTSATTPSHQDHFYIRGAVETYSCWTPLGECPKHLGGLAVLPGSHRQGFIEHDVSTPGAVGGRGVEVDEAQATWHTSDFGLGDALFFHSFTIHKALPNLTSDQLRVSTDNRYQRPQDDIEPGALKPHFDLN
jgi:ectoine hydroxylase-related dioxygenase (phytanoyl-CoA dioxygenase family)